MFANYRLPSGYDQVIDKIRIIAQQCLALDPKQRPDCKTALDFVTEIQTLQRIAIKPLEGKTPQEIVMRKRPLYEVHLEDGSVQQSLLTQKQFDGLQRRLTDPNFWQGQRKLNYKLKTDLSNDPSDPNILLYSLEKNGDDIWIIPKVQIGASGEADSVQLVQNARDLSWAVRKGRKFERLDVHRQRMQKNDRRIVMQPEQMLAHARHEQVNLQKVGDSKGYEERIGILDSYLYGHLPGVKAADIQANNVLYWQVLLATMRSTSFINEVKRVSQALTNDPSLFSHYHALSSLYQSIKLLQNVFKDQIREAKQEVYFDLMVINQAQMLEEIEFAIAAHQTFIQQRTITPLLEDILAVHNKQMTVASFYEKQPAFCLEITALTNAADVEDKAEALFYQYPEIMQNEALGLSLNEILNAVIVHHRHLHEAVTAPVAVALPIVPPPVIAETVATPPIIERASDSLLKGDEEIQKLFAKFMIKSPQAQTKQLQRYINSPRYQLHNAAAELVLMSVLDIHDQIDDEKVADMAAILVNLPAKQARELLNTLYTRTDELFIKKTNSLLKVNLIDKAYLALHTKMNEYFLYSMKSWLSFPVNDPTIKAQKKILFDIEKRSHSSVVPIKSMAATMPTAKTTGVKVPLLSRHVFTSYQQLTSAPLEASKVSGNKFSSRVASQKKHPMPESEACFHDQENDLSFRPSYRGPSRGY